MYAIVREKPIDDGYDGTTTCSEFVPMKSEAEVLEYIKNASQFDKFQVVTYTEVAIEKTVKLVEKKKTKTDESGGYHGPKCTCRFC